MNKREKYFDSLRERAKDYSDQEIRQLYWYSAYLEGVIHELDSEIEILRNPKKKKQKEAEDEMVSVSEENMYD